MKNHFKMFILGLVLTGCGPSSTYVDAEKPEAENLPKIYEKTGSIEVLDESLNQVISPNAQIEIIASGFNWSEGPVWVPAINALLFSDVPENKIYKWTEEDSISVFLKPSGYTGASGRGGEPGSNGLTLDGKGHLLLCQHGDRRVAILETALSKPRPNYRTIARKYEEKIFNSPNDLCVDKQGNIYFTDPPYGLAGGMDDSTKAIPFQGVFKIDTSGNVSLVTDQMTRPNGIALSPDEKTLYIANSDPEKAIWMSFPIDENGVVGEGQLFYDATSMVDKAKGLPDGLKVTQSGHIFATGPGGVWVFDSGATLIGKILTGQATANCAFNEDESILYLTADMHLMRLHIKG